jgi:aminopeptidase N
MHLKSIRVAVILLTLFIAVSGVLPVAAQNGKADLPPTQYVPSRDFDTLHIALDLRFDWSKEQAIGSATISFAPLVNNFNRIVLDAADMTISKVLDSTGATLRFSQETAAQKLFVNFPATLPRNRNQTITIFYHTNGTAETRSINGGGGLTFIQPRQQGAGRQIKQIWSQGESVYSHYWFPCYDNPNDFFTSEVTATVEKPLTVISNGKLIEQKENPEGTRTFHWKIEQPHAAYLTSIAVGEYVPVSGEYKGIPIETYVYPDQVEAGKVTTQRLPEMVAYFAEKTGVEYPYAKYAQTVARNFSGGMENISATTQTDLIIHDARTELDHTSDSIQSHELAHQWFGDLVTCRSWSDIWLNESFATYFQALWDEYKFGHDEFLYSDIGEDHDKYFESWSEGQRRPIVTKNYSDPDAVFDNYAYQRGAAVLHMLRKQLGDDAWWRVINHYLTKYRHQPVETEQFRIAIEEVTGQSMDRFFDQWLYRMGHPIFEVTKKYDPNTKSLLLTVKQNQQVDKTNSFPQVDLFETPVEIEIGTASGTKIERVLIKPLREQSFKFEVDSEPRLVNFDYESTLIKELRFEKPKDELAYQLKNDADVMGRLWALDRLSEILSNPATPPTEKNEVTTTLASALESEKFPGARAEILKTLAGQKTEAVRSILVKSTKENAPKVRAAAVSALAKSGDSSLAELYISLLKDPSYAVVRAAASALASTKDPRAFEALAQLAEGESWRGNLRAAALRGLATLDDTRALTVALKYVDDTEPESRAEAVRLVAKLGASTPTAFAIINSALDDAVENQNSLLIAAAGEGFVLLEDKRGLGVLEAARKRPATGDIQKLLGNFEDALKERLSNRKPTEATAK